MNDDNSRDDELEGVYDYNNTNSNEENSVEINPDSTVYTDENKTENKADTGPSYTGEYGNIVMGERYQPTQSVNPQSEKVAEQSAISNEAQPSMQEPFSAYNQGDNSFQQQIPNETNPNQDLYNPQQMDESAYYNYNGNGNASNPYNSNSPNNPNNPNNSYRTESEFEQFNPYDYGNNENKNESNKEAKPLTNVFISAVIFGLVAGGVFLLICFIGGISLKSNKTLGSTYQKTNGDEVYNNNSGDIAVVTTNSGVEKSVTEIVDETMPAMTKIVSTEEGKSYYDIFGNNYGTREAKYAGSGFIIAKSSDEILIATNNHVVENAKKISCQFIDDEVYEAYVKGTNPSHDIGVIAIKLKDLKDSTLDKIRVCTLGDSDNMKVGEKVVAIGNSLGYGQSVTVGYLSAKDRVIASVDEEGNKKTDNEPVLQTDAAINPGNSGGPLLNTRGEVIGINSAKALDTKIEGVCYAIPISDVLDIINDLLNNKVLNEDEKGYLGIIGISVSNANTNIDLPDGVYIQEISEDGAAYDAKLQVGDIITKIDKETVTTIEKVQEEVTRHAIGEVIKVTYLRLEDGEYKEHTADVKLKGVSTLDKLNDSPSPSPTPASGNDFFGGGIW